MTATPRRGKVQAASRMERDEDAALFDELYKRHHARVFRTCLRFAAGDRDWAMDRAHDTFIKLAHHLRELHDPGDLGGWLYRVSVTTCLMELRRQRGFRAVTARLAAALRLTQGSPERQAQARRDVTALEAAIQDLPATQRALMVLIHLEGKSQVEAASLLALSQGQISKLYKRALDTLRARDWEIDDV